MNDIPVKLILGELVSILGCAWFMVVYAILFIGIIALFREGKHPYKREDRIKFGSSGTSAFVRVDQSADRTAKIYD